VNLLNTSQNLIQQRDGAQGADTLQQLAQNNAKKQSDAGNTAATINSIGASFLALIPGFGPILSAAAAGIGAGVNAGIQEDAKKKSERAALLSKQSGGQGGSSQQGGDFGAIANSVGGLVKAGANWKASSMEGGSMKNASAMGDLNTGPAMANWSDNFNAGRFISNIGNRVG